MNSLLSFSISACFVLSLIFAPASISYAQTAGQRRFVDIKQELEVFSKRAKDSESDESRLNSVLDLCMLFYEIRTDRRYATSETLQGYGRRVHYRLNEVKKQIVKDSKNKSQAVDTRQSAVGSIDYDELDQETADEMYAVAVGISDQMQLISWSHGGAHRVVDSAGGYFGGILEANADDLIRLIENTIHPDTWETNGGINGIGYWSQSMVLVVRATTQVQEDLERFLNMLRYSF